VVEDARMQYVPSGAARLACDVEGAGPAVLLLHAGVNDRRSWRPLVAALGGRCRSIAYDRRGFGETAYDPEPFGDVADAVAVLDAFGVDSAVVIGASNGGRCAIDLALAHPERVLGLGLIGAAVSSTPEPDPLDFAAPVQRLWQAYDAAEAAGDVAALNRIEAHAWLDGWAAEEGRVTGAARDLFLAMNDVALRAEPPGSRATSPDAWDRLVDLSVPLLVLLGELDVVCEPASRHLATQVPGARYEVLAGTGHLPHLEGHARCLELLTEFIDAALVDAGVVGAESLDDVAG
jgi:pimeloyl-ACP methyl ester carboxylesterase